jgi:rod shape-determining protein MreC
MGVITPNGILGVVFKSGKHFSLVKSVLSQDINTDVSIGNKGIHGILKWGGKHAKFGTITGVSNDLVVKKWSKVKTLGASGIFPKGIVIGSVYKIKRVENQALWDITIKYSEDYRSLQVAYIVNALFLKETQALERSIPLEPEL